MTIDDTWENRLKFYVTAATAMFNIAASRIRDVSLGKKTPNGVKEKLGQGIEISLSGVSTLITIGGALSKCFPAVGSTGEAVSGIIGAVFNFLKIGADFGLKVHICKIIL